MSHPYYRYKTSSLGTRLSQMWRGQAISSNYFLTKISWPILTPATVVPLQKQQENVQPAMLQSTCGTRKAMSSSVARQPPKLRTAMATRMPCPLRYPPPPPPRGVGAVAEDEDEVQAASPHLVEGVAEDEVARRKWQRRTRTRDDCSHRIIGTFTLSRNSSLCTSC